MFIQISKYGCISLIVLDRADRIFQGEDESTSLAAPNKKLKMTKKSMAEKGRNVLDTIKVWF